MPNKTRKIHTSKYKPKYETKIKQILNSNNPNSSKIEKYNNDEQIKRQRLELKPYVNKELKVQGQVIKFSKFKNGIINLLLKNVKILSTKETIPIDHITIRLPVRKTDLKHRIKLRNNITFMGTVWSYSRKATLIDINDKTMSMKTTSYGFRDNRLIRETETKKPLQNQYVPLKNKIFNTLNHSYIGKQKTYNNLMIDSIKLADNANTFIDKKNEKQLLIYTANLIQICKQIQEQERRKL